MRNRTRMMACGLAGLMLVANGFAAQEQAEVEISLNPAPDAGGADGKVRFSTRGSRADLRAELEDVPLGVYQLYIGGVQRGSVAVVATSTGTEGELEFSTPAEPGDLFLDFDPSGQAIEWRFGGKVVLSNVLPRFNDGSDIESPFEPQVVQLAFTRIHAPASALGSVEVKANRTKVDLRIRLSGLARGETYIVTADGMEIASLTAGTKGRARLDLSTRAKGKKLPLSFDPARAVFEVWSADEQVLIAPLAGAPIGGGLQPPGRLVVDMLNTGLDGDAHGTAELRQRRGRVDFQVEVEDLQPGVYDLRVADAIVGSIVVGLRADGTTEGEIEFSTNEDDGTKLPFDFDPSGAAIEVLQGDAVYLMLNFPA